MEERKQYMIYVSTTTISLTVAYYLTAFTSFTMPFVKLNLSRSGSTAILCLISVVCLALHWIAIKNSWETPDILKGGIAGAMPAALYGSMISVKYSSMFLMAIFVAILVTKLTAGSMEDHISEKAERIHVVLSIWTVLLLASAIITYNINNTRMIRYAVYSNTIGADNCLYEKQQYSANKLHSMLPRTIAEGTPFMVMYAYLPPDETVVIDGIFIKVSVQYAEQVDEQELYASICDALYESTRKKSVQTDRIIYNC